MIVQTPSGPQEVPDGTECLCVQRHKPNPSMLMPFPMPRGYTIWMCPNTFLWMRDMVQKTKDIQAVPLINPEGGRHPNRYKWLQRWWVEHQLLEEAMAKPEKEPLPEFSDRFKAKLSREAKRRGK